MYIYIYISCIYDTTGFVSILNLLIRLAHFEEAMWVAMSYGDGSVRSGMGSAAKVFTFGDFKCRVSRCFAILVRGFQKTYAWCCVFLANRHVRAASSGVQSAWQAWDIVRVPFLRGSVGCRSVVCGL